MRRLISRLLTASVAGCAMLAVSVANAGVNELPADIQSLYNQNFLDPNQPIGESAYRDWVAKNPPPGKLVMRHPTRVIPGVQLLWIACKTNLFPNGKVWACSMKLL